jgi:ubiquinone/menaquinone biosynthesis C-methylase UbiE
MADPATAAEAARRLAARASARSEVEARRRMLDRLDPRPGEIIVDVGAGSGLLSVELAHRVAPGGRIFAVDPSAPLLDHARAAASAAGVGHMVDLRVADGARLPFGPAAFDAAFCHWVLLHVPDPLAVIREMMRVTRRRGRVMCVEMDWETAIVHPGAEGLTRRIFAHAQSRQIDGWIGRRLSPLFREAGFETFTIEPIVDVDEGGGDRSWLDYLKERAALALEAKAISVSEAESWSEALEEAFAGKRFFFAVTQFAALGRVPG